MPLSDPQKLADRAARRRQRSVVILVLSNAGVGLLLAFLVYSVLSASKASYTQQANDLAEGMAAIAQVSIASDLGQANRLAALATAHPRNCEDARHGGRTSEGSL
jgi:hypothetical protein